MKLTGLLNLLICVMLLFSCRNSGQKVINIETPSLRYSSILKADSVLLFLELNGNTNQETAKYYLTKADETAEANIKKAIWNVCRAITFYPEYQSYQRLAELYIKDLQYDNAIEVYDFILWQVSKYKDRQFVNYYVFKQPDEKVMIDYFACWYLKEKLLPVYVVDRAVNSDLNRDKLKELLLKDKRLDLKLDVNNFDKVMLCFINQEEILDYCNKPENFTAFINRITEKSNSFFISKENVSNFNYENYNGMNFEEEVDYNYLEEGFFQEKKVKNNFWFKYNIKNLYTFNDSFYVLHYACDTSEIACPKEMRHIYHALTIYNKQGNILDYKIVGTQSGEDLTLFSLNQNIVTISDYKRKWRKPYNKQDFDNEVLKTDFVKQYKFKINANGLFDKMQEL